MEQWIRGLSKPTALLLGAVMVAVSVGLYVVFDSTQAGLIPMLLFCAVLGMSAAFTLLLLMKGITGQTPLQKKEARQQK